LGLGEPSRQGLLQLRLLALEEAFSQVTQLLGIGLPCRESSQHQLATRPQRITGHLAQLDVGALNQLLNPIGQGGLFPYQTLPVPGQSPQLANGAGRNEAGREQTMPQQIGQPLGINDIGLAGFVPFGVTGLGENHVQGPFQNVKDGAPLHPRALNRHVRAPLPAEPIKQP
jgi:hypothetical protein